ncbi:MAG: ABC transporter permease, partial [Flavobacteriales bacterium]
MFKEIFLFEFRYWFKRSVLYIYFGIILTISFLIAGVESGMFESLTSSIDRGENLINSPYSVFQSITGLFTLTIFFLPAIMGTCIYRDFRFNMHSFLYTMPINKTGYLLGRFLASVIITVFIYSSIPLAFLAAYNMAWVPGEYIADFRLVTYLQPLLLYILPNVIMFGALIFAIVTLSRNITAGYITIIVIFLLNSLSSILLNDLDNEFLAAMLDPYGQEAFGLDTKYWSISEKNAKLIPLSGALIKNRLLWTGIGAVIFMFTYWRFTFSQFGSGLFSFKKKKIKSEESPVEEEVGVGSGIELPDVNRVFNWKVHWNTLWNSAFKEFKTIVTGTNFIIFTLLGIFFMILASTQVGKMYDTETYPVTRQVLSLATG